jgi:hypothetical protein
VGLVTFVSGLLFNDNVVTPSFNTTWLNLAAVSTYVFVAASYAFVGLVTLVRGLFPSVKVADSFYTT